MKSVLLVTKPLCPPLNDGTKALVRDLAASMKKFTPSYFTIKSDAAPPIGDGKPLKILSEQSAFQVSNTDRLRMAKSLILGEKPDVFHFISVPNKINLRALKAIRKVKRSMKCVMTLPTLSDDTEELKGLNATIVVTSRHSKDILEKMGLEDVQVIYPAADPERVENMANAEIQEHILKTTTDDPYIIYAGDREPESMFFLLKTYHRLFKMKTGLALLVAARWKTGKNVEIGSSFASTRSSIETSTDEIHILDVDNVLPFIKRAEALVMPLKNMEHKMDIPMVILEALSLGKPVFLSDSPTLKELHELDPLATVMAESHVDMAEKLKSAFESRDRMDELSGRARELFDKRFKASNMAARYEELYEELQG